MNQTELIVVGAGSAGCVLASRLAQQYGFRLTLIEPPVEPAPAPDTNRPARWLNLLGSSEDWDLLTEPLKALAGRQLRSPRGRGLGGCNRINAMIWFPPTERDMQMMVDARGGLSTIREVTRALDDVCKLAAPETPLWLSEASRRFLSAAEGTTNAKPMIYDRLTRRGRRWTPASLLSQSGQGTIEIIHDTVDRVIFNGDRAVGVRLGNSRATQRASIGVVLCAGAVATPTILMRSGIGQRETLDRHGIDVRHDVASIGANLQDHLIMPVVFRTRDKTPFTLSASMRDIVRWQTLGTGPISSNIAECGGLFHDDAIQIHLTPTHYLSFPKQASESAMTIAVNVTQPASRGHLTLRSPRFDDPPRMDPGYLTEPSDLSETIRGVRLARSLASDRSLAPWITAEAFPGSKREQVDSIAKSISRYALTLYHPVGTCRMGSDTDAGVDSAFAVKGSEGLWVADASVLPKLTVGNPNATVMTLSSLAADAISATAQA